MAGDFAEHFFVLNGAGSGDAESMGAADAHLGGLAAADFYDRVIFVKLAAGEFVGLHDGDDFFHAVQAGQVCLVEGALFADGSDDGAELAAREMGFVAHSLNFRDDPVDARRIGGMIHDDNQARLLRPLAGNRST